MGASFYIVEDKIELKLKFVWLEEWKSGRMENWKDRKVLVFLYECLVKGVEMWEDGKFNLYELTIM